MEPEDLGALARTPSIECEGGTLNRTYLQDGTDAQFEGSTILRRQIAQGNLPRNTLSSSYKDESTVSLLRLINDSIDGIIAMSHRLDVKEESLRNADWVLQERLASRDMEIQDTSLGLMYQVETLWRISSQMRVLEGNALTVSIQDFLSLDH